MSVDQIGLWAGFVLTLMIFSYILGDNFLYRLAVYAFAGLAAGFVTMVTVESVILPWLRATIGAAQASPLNLVVGAVPFVFGALLLARTTQRWGRLGSIALGFIVGIGSAVAVVGAASGTLIPLTARTVDETRVAAAVLNATDDSLGLLNSFIVALGVICTLVYFQYSARRVPGSMTLTRRGLVTRAMGAVGQSFIVVTLAALYGGAILTGLTIFTDRMAFLLQRILGS